MARFNNGLIYTSEECCGCSLCISDCPVLGANVTVGSTESLKVAVSDKCINCGICISKCEHKARNYRDDSERFVDALNEGKHISLLVDPAFYVDFGEDAYYILQNLKDMGVEKIYNVAFGAEISMYLHAKYIKEHTDDSYVCSRFIANNCSSTKAFVEKVHSDLIEGMIPVMSPVNCTAVYAKRYLCDFNEFAYLTPCVASLGLKGVGNSLINYGITFENLIKLLKGKKDNYSSAEIDLKEYGFGNLVAFRDGFIKGVSMFFDHKEIFVHHDSLGQRVIKLLRASCNNKDVVHPTMVTVSACADGCVMGHGVNASDFDEGGILKRYSTEMFGAYGIKEEYQDNLAYYEHVSEIFRFIYKSDFEESFEDLSKQPNSVPENVIEEIFESMHKNTEKKKNINCRSCGYSSCREMAIAVANGYSKISHCVLYMNDKMKYSSLVDDLTGAKSSKGFFEEAEKLVKANPDKTYVIGLGDINKLKNVNDLYGAETGDKLIIYLAKRIEEMAKVVGGVSGRASGAVFAACFEYKKENLDSFTKYEYVNAKHLGIDFPITLRCGFYVLHPGESLSKVVNLVYYAVEKNADRSKNSYVIFDESMREEMKAETNITRAMRSAMTDGEFVLYLQPQFNHENGEIVGAEVLSRWIKEDGTMISPGDFIPVFEKNGFIKKFDKYVLESTFKMVYEWQELKKKTVPVSVNISRMSFENDSIIDIIARLAKKYPVDKDLLYFEITESAYMTDKAGINARLSKIRSLGFKIAMDDFGSGYSSLNSLKDMPIDVLKLDMGFVRGESNIEKGKMIVGFMVDMALALDLKLVAEGVETKGLADFLCEKGSSIIQGYYYARPVPKAEYEEMLFKE